MLAPTRTPTPVETPRTKTATNEPVPFTLFDTVFIMGVSRTGEKIYGNPYDFFHTFTTPSNEFALLRFIMQITEFHYTINGISPAPTAIPTEKWRIFIHRYRIDGAYINQFVIETSFKTDVIPYADRLLMYLTADVSMNAIQTKFGDCSAFTYQVIDGQGRIQQQGDFSINPHLLFSSGGGLVGNLKDGVTLGFPYSLNEKETEFFHQGQFVTINEPRSGFYLLTYLFNFTNASGVYGIVEQKKLVSELTARLYPCQEEGNYSAQDAFPAIGSLINSTDIYRVILPIDHLKNKVTSSNRYYLQVVDGEGKIIKYEYFLFIP